MPRRSLEVNPDRIVGQACGTVAAGNRSAQHCPHGPMSIAHRQFDLNRHTAFERSLRLGEQVMIEHLLQAMVLRLHAAPRHARRHWWIVKNGRQVQSARLPMIDGRLRVEHVDAANHLVHAAETQFGHVLPNLLGQKEEEVDDVLRLPLKSLAQHGVLRGDADRTGVEMAFAHHDAAHRDQRRGGETKFFGAEERGDHDIAPGLQLAVGLHADSTTQIVQQEHLLRLRQPKLPRNAGVLNRTQRRGSRASAVATDQNNIRVGFGNAGRHRAHSDFRD